MAKAKANTARGEEALPGLEVTMRLSIDALERIESQFADADHWLAKVSEELMKPSPKAIRTCIEAGVEGGIDFEIVGTPGNPTWVDLGNHVVDALFRSVYGMTFDERVEHEAKMEAEQTKKKMERMLEDPSMVEMMTLLSLRASEKLDTDQASAPVKSET